ncbi:MAG TPA: polysaccharide deacetylase family protein [Candidatus Eisenbacteria bacterium]|nr:polysaccharide deacetylase family protein [Candidatus Eisenbacteria bacterium]
MSRSLVRRLVAGIGYGLGVTQAVTRAGDRWRVLRGGRGVSVGRRQRDAFLVLLYHRVNRAARHFTIERTEPDAFRAQMEHLARQFHVMPLGDIVRRARAQEPLPPRAVAITFDDGYEDNYTEAYPVLRDFGLPATVFLATGCIGTGESLWFDRVLGAFRTARADSVTLPGGALEEGLRDPEVRERVAHRALYALMRLPNAERAPSIDRLVRDLDPEDLSHLPAMMTWDQVRLMAADGITFGAHTVTHPILSRLTLDEAESEIVGSKRRIEEEIRMPVNLFAYPVGRRSDYSPGVLDLVARAGFDAALTTTPAANAIGDDPYLLRRVKPLGDDVPTFALGLGAQYVTEWRQFEP